MSRTNSAADPSPKLRLVRGSPAEAELSLSPRIAARLALVGIVGGKSAHPRRPVAARTPDPRARRSLLRCPR